MAAACISGLTLLYRPLVLLPLFGAFTALAFNHGGWRCLIRRRFLIFLGISLAPPVLYYGYGVLVAGFLRWKVDTSFLPHLLLERIFWMNWLYLAGTGVGYAALVGALLGATMLRKGLPRALVTGLGLGYVAFGLLFTMHIHTHGYYQAVLIPIVAISFGPLVTSVADRLRQTAHPWYWWPAVIAACALAVSFSFLEVRSQVGSQVFESEETAQAVGDIVNHSSHVVFLARYYGQPLQYNGELTGAYWPRRISYYLYRRDEPELSIQQRLDALGFSPEYFVITDFNEFENNHADLKEYLANRCSLVAKHDQYLIYNACALP